MHQDGLDAWYCFGGRWEKNELGKSYGNPNDALIVPLAPFNSPLTKHKIKP